MNEFEQDVFAGKTYEQAIEYARLEMIDQMNKLKLTKINFAQIEAEGKNELDKLDQIYTKNQKRFNEDNYDEFADFIDYMAKCRIKAEKCIELCQYMEKNIDMNLEAFQKVKDFINEVA